MGIESFVFYHNARFRAEGQFRPRSCFTTAWTMRSMSSALMSAVEGCAQPEQLPPPAARLTSSGSMSP